MESSFVLFKPHIHLFACTHLSVSNSLDYHDWLAYKHKYPALGLEHVWIVVACRCASISLHPFDQKCLDCGPLLFSSIASSTCGLWILLCVHASVSSPVFQTRLDYGSVSVYKNLSPATLIKHVWIVAPCCVHASVATRVSNTFVVPGPCTSSVYSPLSQTRLILVSYLCTLPPTPK